MPTMPTLPSIPDIDFQKIADNTYDSDRLNIGDQLNNSNYIILKKLDNPDGNGAQGIAVVSKKDYDKGNFSNIIISYRGTEPSAGDGDINADINQIIFGVSDKVDGMGNPIPTQFDTALNFANEIKNTYNPPNMSVTGHSLGGGLAAYVGAELDIYGKMFSAPNVFRLLSDAAKKR
ncbi:Lipase (class 3), partial [Isobaculum melis]